MIERLSRSWRKLRAVLRRRELEQDMHEEMRAHLEMEAEDRMRRHGLAAAEAHRQARIAFGGVERFKAEGRDVRGFRPLEDALRDMRYALRTLTKSPAFSVVSVVTLGLGIGAVTAMFALVNAILIQPLPYPEADRLVAVKHAAPGLGYAETGLSSGTYFHYRAHAPSFDGLALYNETALNFARPGVVAERVEVAYAGPELFDVLGVTPILGRLFTREDGERGSMDMTWTVPVLLSHDFWRSRFGGAPEIIGRVITLNDHPREVVGVLPEDFVFPRPETQIWVLSMPPEVTANFAVNLDSRALARLRPGVSPTVAQAELKRILPSIEGVYEDATAERLAEVRLTPIVVPLKDEVVGDAGTILWLLLGGMAFLLLVACANLANLFLLRAEDRAGEIAVRAALGAKRADLLRLFLGETALVSVMGAAVGTLLASGAIRALIAFVPIDLPRLGEVRMDAWVFAFVACLAVLVALFAGGLSYLRHTVGGTPPAPVSGHTASLGRIQRQIRNGLVTAQIAFALMLVLGSALMVRSFLRLSRVDPGFAAANVVTVGTALPSDKASSHIQIYAELLDRIRALPGVRSAGAVSAVPLVGGGHAYPLRAVDPPRRDASTGPPIETRFFLPGYFQAIGISVEEGAGFAAEEIVEQRRPVVTSAALARRLFGGESAIGREVRRLERNGSEVQMFDLATKTTQATAPWTVAGVVADVRENSLRAEPAEVLYIPVIEPRVESQIVPTSMTFVIRSKLPISSLVPAVRHAIREAEPEFSIVGITSMEAIISRSTSIERFLTVLLLIAGSASIFLGAVGIYGIVAQAVRRRTREIGIRVAVGAHPGQVLGLVFRESLSIILAGVAIGLTGALAGTRALGSFLFEISPTDPVTWASATGALLAVALLAAFLPARRAAQVDPVVALRGE